MAWAWAGGGYWFEWLFRYQQNRALESYLINYYPNMLSDDSLWSGWISEDRRRTWAFYGSDVKIPFSLWKWIWWCTMWHSVWRSCQYQRLSQKTNSITRAPRNIALTAWMSWLAEPVSVIVLMILSHVGEQGPHIPEKFQTCLSQITGTWVSQLTLSENEAIIMSGNAFRVEVAFAW